MNLYNLETETKNINLKQVNVKMKHSIIAVAHVHYKNGAIRSVALLEADRDYVIALGYHADAGNWDAGIYMQKHDKSTEILALKNFASGLERELESGFVERISF